MSLVSKKAAKEARKARGRSQIHSTSGDFFERKMDLEIEREFQRGAAAKEASCHDELSAKAKAILDIVASFSPTEADEYARRLEEQRLRL
jgi:hypothetical protein